MSTTTILDPFGTEPNVAYNNDKKLTEEMLLFVENSNLAQSKGLHKLSIQFNTATLQEVSLSVVNNNGSGGTVVEATTNYFNLLKTTFPHAVNLVGFSISVSKYANIGGAGLLKITTQKSTAANDAPRESSFSDLDTLTVNSTSGTNATYKNATVNHSFAAGNHFRVKLESAGGGTGNVQVTAIFKTDHI
jgi:hypothetical protein